MVHFKDHSGVVLQSAAQSEVNLNAFALYTERVEKGDCFRELIQRLRVETVGQEECTGRIQSGIGIPANGPQFVDEGERPVHRGTCRVCMHACRQAGGHIFECSTTQIACAGLGNQTGKRVLGCGRKVWCDGVPVDLASLVRVDDVRVERGEPGPDGLDTVTSGVLKAFEQQGPSTTGEAKMGQQFTQNADITDGYGVLGPRSA